MQPRKYLQLVDGSLRTDWKRKSLNVGKLFGGYFQRLLQKFKQEVVSAYLKAEEKGQSGKLEAFSQDGAVEGEGQGGEGRFPAWTTW
jgi:hypothetical protein